MPAGDGHRRQALVCYCLKVVAPVEVEVLVEPGLEVNSVYCSPHGWMYWGIFTPHFRHPPPKESIRIRVDR